MATRKVTKTTKPSKTSRNSKIQEASVSVKRAASKTKRKTAEVVEDMTPLSVSSSMSGISKFPVSRKVTYTILLALGLVVILFAINKYLVVAWVDQTPVTAFEYYDTLSKRYGNDVSEELIVQKLLENEADDKDIEVSKDELNAEIQKIEEQQGGADKLEQILQAQNISRDEFQRLVNLQLLRTKLFSDVAAVTDADVDAYIAENGDAFAPTTDASTGATIDPKQDPKLRESITEQLKQQKTNASFSAWLQEARQSPRIVKNWE